ncbi:MAG TPA: VWA domain-containing protein [Gordonia sp. (in: high G+C Gram-positive bacteria)]|uniref:vWA domain-containing protein n=1 Tax=unclassified Gordonia (in: high G+C Gram-positive bacteria) TaxID=2657482 RepID=UPI000FB54E66|nr:MULTISPECIES: VWA domain-containing protein [unclassified Gordonia (in: high G+C Gram-positive bacteria)]RTL08404.1 MAG: VWA domain-containing protein [Acidimicrobiia bacterium]HNP58151.1 VWA domain-containing protein [Gordonia sp. (in: high G+C Gram-positive bacteria)]HRC51060.1 VWA domain-containing protein [Gordonia sp. (in: high G+C Gram-positive bacteria)]
MPQHTPDAEPGRNRRNFHRSRYDRYRGGPDPLAPPLDLREALDEIGADVMAGSSPRRAIRELLRRGMPGMRGLDELRERINRRRNEMLRNRNLDGTFQEIRELLDRAVLEERKQLARDLDDDARFAEMQLGNLPPSTAAAVNELGEYQWRSAQAREDFEKIRDLLGRELLEQRFAGMKEALEGADENDRQAITDMLADLNELLAKHNRGEDTTDEFAEFMDKHGQFFPENPRNTDELVESLARRSAAAQQFYNSLSPEQRAELDQLSQQAFGSPDLMAALAGVDDQLRLARPDLDWNGSQGFSGDQPMGLGEAAAAMADLAELDQLSEAMSQQYAGADLADIDLEALARQLGDDAAVDARTLAELEKALRDQGYFERGADGELRLSPKAMRQLGQSVLADIAERLTGRGERSTRLSGRLGEPTGATREWAFGDTEPWDVSRTITNAVLREAGAGGFVPGSGVAIDVGDVEITETEARSQAAVVLLVDTSFSMEMEGRWTPMKRTAIALNHLISTRFRTDELAVIAFGREARTIDVGELAGLSPRMEQGTNLHHALLLAQRHLRRFPHATPVVLIVTDGEPTAHLDPSGEPFFFYPPHPQTIGLTVAELDHVARMGAQVTIFRLGDDPGLAMFIDRVARRIGGRVVAPDVDGLGAAVVGDYLRGRRGR